MIAEESARDETKQDAPDPETSARPTPQQARQGRNGKQILIVLAASVGLLAVGYMVMLTFTAG